MTNTALYLPIDCDEIDGCGAPAGSPCRPGCPLADAEYDAALLAQIDDYDDYGPVDASDIDDHKLPYVNLDRLRWTTPV